MKNFFLILFMTTLAHAGVHTVGKGGGYAEMQAVLINTQIRALTDICFEASSSCGLSPDETDALRKAVAASFLIEFSPQCLENPLIVRSPSSATLSSCALYDTSQAVAKSFSDIASWVLSARLLATQKTSLDRAWALAQKVFRDYRQSEQPYSVVLSESEVLFHFQTIERGQSIYQFVSLEGRTKTLEITTPVQKLLSCQEGSLGRWQINPLSSQELSPGQGTLESEIQWSCSETESYRATLQIYFSAPKGEVLPESVRVHLVQKERLEDLELQ